MSRKVALIFRWINCARSSLAGRFRGTDALRRTIQLRRSVVATKGFETYCWRPRPAEFSYRKPARTVRPACLPSPRAACSINAPRVRFIPPCVSMAVERRGVVRPGMERGRAGPLENEVSTRVIPSVARNPSWFSARHDEKRREIPRAKGRPAE